MHICAAFYLFGVLIALGNNAPPHSTTAILCIVIAAVVTMHRAARLPALLLLGFGWGSLHVAAALDNRLAADLEGQVQVLGGVVAAFATRHGELLSLQLSRVSPRRATETALPSRISLVWSDAPVRPALGAWCELHVRLKRPHGLANPGGRDVERASFIQAIGATGHVIAHPGNLCVDIASRRSIAGLRSWISTRIDTAIPAPRTAAVIKALAVSDRSSLDSRQREVMIATGTGHLLAISGLHISLVAGWTFLLLRFVGGCLFSCSQSYAAIRFAWLGALAAAVAYAALAGFGVPSRRAAIVVAAAACAALGGRRVLSSDNLCYALIAVVTVDPLTPLSGSFCLSFSAAAVLVWLSTVRRRPKSALGLGWRSHVALAIGIAPFAALFFGQLSLTAPLANLLAVPWSAIFIVPLTMIGIVCATVNSAWSSIAWDMAGRLWEVLWWFLELVARISPPASVLGLVDAADAALLLVGLCVLALPRGVPGRMLGVLLLCILLLPRQRPLRDGEFRLNVFDVGQGLAVLVETRSHTALYDTGPRFWGRATNAGTVVIVPGLMALRVARLDAVIVSHTDADHASGVDVVLQQFPTTRVLVQQRTGFAADLCSAPNAWRWDGVEFRLLHPFPQDEGSRNDRSCVLAIEGRHGRALLPGDVELAGETLLGSRYGSELAADIVIVPHHGSRTSSSAAFVARVAPHYAVVSAGYRNRYGFPHPDVVARYRDIGAEVLNTADHGTLTVELRSGGIYVDAYRLSGWGFWRAPSDEMRSHTMRLNRGLVRSAATSFEAKPGLGD